MVATTLKPKAKPELKPIPPDAVLLSLDASSSACGWARLSGTQRLLGFGLIKPPASWDSRRRIDHIVLQVADLAKGCTHAVCEHQSHKSGGGGFHAQGLAVLGQAQGEIVGMLKFGALIPRENIDLVSEREWTKVNGRNTPKKDRAQYVLLIFPEYDRMVATTPGYDAGLDVADALGIAVWRLSVK